MKRGAKEQTVFLTAVNAVVRGLGLLMRILLSRMLGAEIMGITELAQSVHMLAITPLTSGLPMAVSRMTAKAQPEKQQEPLIAGIWLVRAASVLLIPGFLLLSPALSRLMGDQRVLPSLWFTAPCILILGYSAVYNGYCYGVELSHLPALSELIEQAARFLIAILLLRWLNRLTAPWLAALPVFATMIAEILGLCFMLLALRLPVSVQPQALRLRKPVLALAMPTTVSRLINTLLRSATAVLIPLRLQASGLSMAESTARLGMLNGMVMPILMLPCIFTSALSMVMTPKLALAESDAPRLKALLKKSFGVCGAAAAFSWLLIDRAAPYLASVVYRSAELEPLFRQAAPLTFLYAFAHVSGGVIAALGLQKHSMYGTLPVSVLTLGCSWLWTADPSMRLTGTVMALMIGQTVAILWNIGVLLFSRRRVQPASA